MRSYISVYVHEHDELADRDPLRVRHTHDRRDEKGDHHGITVLAEVPSAIAIYQLAMSRERALDLHARLEEALCEAMSMRPYVRPPVGAIVSLVLDPCSAGESAEHFHGVEVLAHGPGEHDIAVQLPHRKGTSMIDLSAGEVLKFDVESLT